MRNLIENWGEAKELFLNPIFLISDFDGTLAPIVDRPENAQISEGIKESLSRLMNFCPIGIISGRALEDLKSRVGIEKIYYSGNHGYEITGPEVDFVKEEARRAKPIIEDISRELGEKTGPLEGVIVENKGLTASVHYRLANEQTTSKLKTIFEDVVEPYQEEREVEINYGRKVLELRPAGEWNKGKAVNLLRRITGFEEEVMPVYLGDDITDEDAFFELEREGVGILVSSEDRESASDFRLQSVDEVEVFLDKLLELLEQV